MNATQYQIPRPSPHCKYGGRSKKLAGLRVKEVRLTMMVLLLSGQEIGGANGAPGTPKFRQSCTALYQILGMPMSYLITAHKSYLIVDAVLSRHIIFFLCGEINIIIKQFHDRGHQLAWQKISLFRNWHSKLLCSLISYLKSVSDTGLLLRSPI